MNAPARFDPYTAWPDGPRALRALEHAIRQSGLDHTVLELVKTRASQLNGCAYCIDMHTKDARTAGETEQRLYALSAWRETPFFTPAERAALALTEAVTMLATREITDQVVDDARAQFGEDGLSKLLFAIATINVWNRIAVTARSVVGGYQPPVGAPH